jgi:plastocyanin
MKRLCLTSLWVLLAWAALAPHVASGATIMVNVGNDFFSPRNVTNNVGDTVQWNWLANDFSHNSTSTGGLWASATQSSGSFSHTFNSAGNFPYECTIHVLSGMTGSVTVQAANAPPMVAISSPANNATFAAPWTGGIQTTDSDSSGMVTKVDFFANTTKLGTVTSPPASFTFTVTNLAAGNYTLTAVVTDSLGATNTSSGVAIKVLAPVPIMLGAPQRPSAGSFQFQYTATPGLQYVVQRAGTLPNFVPLATNLAASSPVTFMDSNATGGFNYYRVTLLPNP